jgi:putative transposase
MSHSYVSQLTHVVFSTKDRRNTIPAGMQQRLWSFLGGIARKNGFKAIAIGGTANHVHILLSMPATIALAKAVQLVKGGSSKLLNQEMTSRFELKQGYGAFIVSIYQQPQTIEYINSKAEHHRRRNFQDELIAFLNKHNIDYDPRYVLG